MELLIFSCNLQKSEAVRGYATNWYFTRDGISTQYKFQQDVMLKSQDPIYQFWIPEHLSFSFPPLGTFVILRHFLSLLLLFLGQSNSASKSNNDQLAPMLYHLWLQVDCNGHVLMSAKAFSRQSAFQIKFYNFE